MNPATKKQAEWLVKRVGGWFLLMTTSAFLVLPLMRTDELNPASYWLVALIGIPSWALPAALCYAGGSDHPNIGLGAIGLILHFLLWMAIWERREVWAWTKEKTKRR